MKPKNKVKAEQKLERSQSSNNRSRFRLLLRKIRRYIISLSRLRIKDSIPHSDLMHIYFELKTNALSLIATR